MSINLYVQSPTNGGWDVPLGHDTSQKLVGILDTVCVLVLGEASGVTQTHQ
jgi:hypothetical protein